MAFGVPPTTHRYLIEHFSGVPHPKTMLSSRYTKFVDCLLTISKPEVAFLANMSVSDNRTVMGKTVTRLKREVDCQDLTANLVKKKVKFFPVPQVEEWRFSYLDELISVEAGDGYIDNSFSSSDGVGADG